MVRTQHPKLPGFESWYKTQANIKTLEIMENGFSKYTVFSDMEFISTNGKYCIYADNYAFTTPIMLLAEELGVSHVVTGDIWAAFTADETVFSPTLEFRKAYLFDAVGLNIEYPCNGISELSSFLVADKALGVNNCTTCQYGEFRKPCMRCIKCFRKSLYRDAVFKSHVVLNNLEQLNRSPQIINFNKDTGQKGRSFSPSIKYCAERISYIKKLSGPVASILTKSLLCNLNPEFVRYSYKGAYHERRPNFIKNSLTKLFDLVPPMEASHLANFEQLDYIKNFPSPTSNP